MVFSAIPQVITEDRASGAQVIEGSLKFDGSKSTRLTKTFASGGDRTSWTWSCWVKRDILTLSNRQVIFGGYGASNDTDWLELGFDSSNDKVYFTTSSISTAGAPERRDPAGWYHFFSTYDGSNLKIYVNNNLDLNHSFSGNRGINNNTAHYIGQTPGNAADRHLDGRLTQCYFIDGQVLNPSDFAYTDPLTGTWRPKKFTGEFSPKHIDNWNDDTTGSGFNSSTGKENAFDGNPNTQAAPGQNGTMSFTPTPAITGISKIRIKARRDAGQATDSNFTLNGTTIGNLWTAGNTATVEITSLGGSPITQLTNLTWKANTNNNEWFGVYQIEVYYNGAYHTVTQGGVNSFYLPLDGNTPIGQDQSGEGNNWDSVAFGGSVELPKATGAIPILKTNDAGTVAKPVRTDKKTYTVTASGGNYYLDGALKPTLNAYRGGSYTFDYTGATSHPLYLSSLQDGKWNSKAYSVQFDGSGDYLSATGTGTLAASSDWCMECFFYCTGNSSGTYRIMSANEASQSTEYILMRIRLGQYQFSTDTANSGTIESAHFNEWTHMALTKSGTTVRGFINGRKIWETTDNNTVTITNLIIGWGYGGEYFPGFISNARFVNGSSVYTADFTPPTTSLTNITNTHLLCCQDNNAALGVISGSITVAGNSAASQTKQPFLYNSNGDLGVNTGTSNTTKITIPHTAADTLYYYCQNHSGMGSSINVTTDIFKADPYAWKNVFAIPFIGGHDPVDFTAEINVNSTNHTIGKNGTPGDNLPQYYGKSKHVTGNSNWYTTPGTTDLQFGRGDYTVEGWVYPHSFPVLHNYFFSTSGSNTSRFAVWGYRNNGVVAWGAYDGSTRPGVISSTGRIASQRWSHLAYQRIGGIQYIYLDGVCVARGASDWDYNQATNVQDPRWGVNSASTGGEYGNLSYCDFRIYKGVGKYPAVAAVGERSFTVGSTTPDVLPDTPSGFPTKTNLTKITEGAVSFPGTTDYLYTSDSTDFEFGDGDFTVEAYINPTGAPGSSGYNCIFAKGESLQFYYMSTGSLTIFASTNYSSNSYDILNGNGPAAGSVSLNKWTHLAVCRSGNDWKIYIDGVEKWNGTASGTIEDNSYGFSIGDYGPAPSNYEFEGFISNLRVIKGTALYTSNFTPPTEPLTEVTNTKLLCCQSPTSATEAAVAPGSIAANGQATATNFNPFTDDINTIRGQATGYATFNPLDKNGGATLSDGNLKIQTVSNVWKNTPTSIGMKTGKFYCEFGPNLWRDNNNHCQPGVRSMALGNTFEMGGTNYTAFYHYTGTKFFNGPGGAGTAFGAAWNDNEHNIIGVAFDADTRKVWFSKNGIWQGGGNPSAGTNEAGIVNPIGDDGSYAFCLGTHGNGGLPNGGAEANFGQKPFKFPPPDGFQPLNLSTVQPEKVIVRPDQYVGVSLWSGNGTSQNITGLKHKPDFVWIKKRAGGSARSHQLFDSVRGVYKTLHSNSAGAEDNNTNRLTAFNQDGFAVGSDDGSNGSSGTFCAWTWKAGGSGSQPFYKDDVGYANASDVNMNVGGQNSFVYNQSQNWTNLITFNAGGWNGNGTAPFDNDATNYDYGDTTRSNGGYATLDISSLTGSRVISVTSEQTEVTITHDGGTTTFTPPNTSRLTHTFAAVSNPTSIKFDGLNGNSQFVLVGVTVDGARLVNSNITPTNVPSIAATGCSVGTKQGFSIIKYTSNGTQGATIPHGLTQKPDFAIFKNLDSTLGTNEVDWGVYHAALGATKNLELNQTLAEGTHPGPFNNTEPTSSVFTFGGSPNAFGHSYLTNGPSGDDFIAYIWHNVIGLQKFGSYTNPSSSDGAFVELGFKPAVLIYKCARNISSSSGAGDWIIIDTTRNPVNNPSDNNTLVLNVDNAEDSYYTASQAAVDILSNGFKIRHNNSSPGGDPGRLYVYAAWAEAPGINLYGAQSNAR